MEPSVRTHFVYLGQEGGTSPPSVVGTDNVIENVLALFSGSPSLSEIGERHPLTIARVVAKPLLLGILHSCGEFATGLPGATTME
jgi:hypothetical protein